MLIISLTACNASQHAKEVISDVQTEHVTEAESDISEVVEENRQTNPADAESTAEKPEETESSEDSKPEATESSKDGKSEVTDEAAPKPRHSGA